MLWTAALLLALLAWLVWGISTTIRRARARLAQDAPPRLDDAASDPSALHDNSTDESERMPNWRGTPR